MSREPGGGDGRIRAKVALLVGYLALATGTLVAVNRPATGYELSIYAATPVAFWLGVGLAVFVSLALSLSGTAGPRRSLALWLGGTAVVAIVALPVVRSYRYYGWNDPMTHLGWVRDLATGGIAPESLFYPAVHTVSLFGARVLGMPLTRAVLVTVVLCVVLYVLFVTLTVRTLTTGPRAVAIGLFSAALVLPVTNLSTHPQAHPFTQTTLLSALLLFLLVVYLSDPDTTGVVTTSPVALLLVVVSLSLVVFHPQAAANVLVVFATLSGLQAVARLIPWRRLDAFRTGAALYLPTICLAVFFVLWTTNFDLLAGNATKLVDSVGRVLQGQSDQAAQNVQTQSESLVAIGASLPRVFLKLFLPAVVFSVLSAIAFFGAVFDRDVTPSGVPTDLVVSLGVGFFPVVVLFGVYLVGGVSEMYFRHLAFVLVPVTLLGAVALSGLLSRPVAVGWPRLSLVIAAVGLAILVPTSLLFYYPSPSIHKPTQHVTDAEMTGYRGTFDRQAPNTTVVGLRGGPWREHDAVVGTGASTGSTMKTGVSGENLSRLGSQLDPPSYFVYSQGDYEREVLAYEELRYARSDFRAVGSQPGVDRVMSNGDVRLFYVPSHSADTPS